MVGISSNVCVAPCWVVLHCRSTCKTAARGLTAHTCDMGGCWVCTPLSETVTGRWEKIRGKISLILTQAQLTRAIELLD
jgi:hypothetical protein